MPVCMEDFPKHVIPSELIAIQNAVAYGIHIHHFDLIPAKVLVSASLCFHIRSCVQPVQMDISLLEMSR